MRPIIGRHSNEASKFTRQSGLHAYDFKKPRRSVMQRIGNIVLWFCIIVFFTGGFVADFATMRYCMQSNPFWYCFRIM